MGKRVNIVRVKATWSPSLETANRVLGDSGMTVVAIGKVGLTADISFEGGDIEDFNTAHLAAANLLADLERGGLVLEASIDVTSRADALPVYTVGDDGAAD